jgi:hypothetical protein
VEEVLAKTAVRTPDLGGTATTSEVGQELANALRAASAARDGWRRAGRAAAGSPEAAQELWCWPGGDLGPLAHEHGGRGVWIVACRSAPERGWVWAWPRMFSGGSPMASW